jgi:hypothetical protein
MYRQSGAAAPATPLRCGPAPCRPGGRQWCRARAGAGGRGPAVVDLHGLHVSEALDALGAELARLAAVGAAGRRVRILVGTGHHSKVRRLVWLGLSSG